MSNRDNGLKALFPWLLAFYSITFSVVYLALTEKYQPQSDLAYIRLGIFILLAPIILKYFIQLLAIPFYSIKERFGSADSDFQIGKRVSVLIPAWNEEVGIIKTIESVLNTNYSNLEVIVINDGSTDNTNNLISAFVGDFEREKADSATRSESVDLRYLNLINGGKARALNRGLRVATGEFIVTIDADSLMDENAITKILKRFADPDVGAVAGNVVIGNNKKPIALLQQLEYMYGFFFKRADSVFNSVYIIGGAAAAYRKNVLAEVGGFDHQIITEDIEMSTRILAAGYHTRYAADAVVYTEGPSDWKSLCRQRLRWKFGRILTFIKHRQLFFSCKPQHKPYLTFLLLPLAVYAEMTLLFEGFLLFIFYGYTFMASDYFPLVFVILFMTFLVSLQILIDPKRKHHLKLLGLAPLAWILFYIIDLVEWQALCRSIKRLVRRQRLEWQKWVRVGL